MRGLDNLKSGRKENEAKEMQFHRRMLRISWTAKKSNEAILREADRTRSLINRVRNRKATFFLTCREKRETRTSFENWKDFEGKRNRGKQNKRCWMD